MISYVVHAVQPDTRTNNDNERPKRQGDTERETVDEQDVELEGAKYERIGRGSSESALGGGSMKRTGSGSPKESQRK